MKFIFTIITSFMLFFQATDINTVRKAYQTASASLANAQSFEKLTNKLPNDAVSKGYKSASKVVLGKFAKPIERRSLLTSGIKSLEANITANPNNAELHLIRLSLQENLPKIVGYYSNIKEDKAFLIKNYSSQNADLKTNIKNFANYSKSFTAAEKASFK